MASSRSVLMGVREANHAKGAILLLAIVFLLLLGLTAQAVLNSSALAMRMADNFHSREVVEQFAGSVALEVAGDLSSFDLTAEVGHVSCLTTSVLAECDAKALSAPLSSSVVPKGATWEVSVKRDYPRYLHRLGVRESERTVSSAVAGRYAVYEVDVRVQAGSRAAISQFRRGVAVRVPR